MGDAKARARRNQSLGMTRVMNIEITSNEDPIYCFTLMCVNERIRIRLHARTLVELIYKANKAFLDWLGHTQGIKVSEAALPVLERFGRDQDAEHYFLLSFDGSPMHHEGCILVSENCNAPGKDMRVKMSIVQLMDFIQHTTDMYMRWMQTNCLEYVTTLSPHTNPDL
jgi:hypothetical protein